jgi:Zn-dependent M28 family amino/carboxypeptidase
VNIKIDSKIITHKALNVLGTIPGETDTFIVFTAHYDHLGGMGRKVYFPGANDNASGTAMVLDLARTLSKSVKHKYSYGFMFFSGEEAGLLGSEYYALNPVFPLKKIKIVINLDMVGTGADGISVFNGSSHPLEFAALDSINKTLNLGLNLKQRGPSQGSDHFAFHKRGIKALFLLTDDKNAPYHTITDTYNQLSFGAYERLFKLIQEYIKSL